MKIFRSGINFSKSLTRPESTFSYKNKTIELILFFLYSYIVFNLFVSSVFVESSKHSILDKTNNAGSSYNKALFKKASIFSIEVSSLHNNKVFIIGIFPVRF